MSTKRTSTIWGVLLAVIGTGPALAGDQYVITDLGVLPGESRSNAVGINNNGQVVGMSGDRVFLWQNGELQELWSPGYATAINNNGMVAGVQEQPTSGLRAVTWYNGELTMLEELPDTGASYALDLNDAGDVVGTISHGGIDAVMWREGALLGILFKAYPNAINNNNQVVGGHGGTGSPVYLWDDGFTSTIEGATTGMDINDAGQVTGKASDPDDHSYMWQDGEFTILPNLALDNDSTPFAMNSQGWVVGQAGGSGGGHTVLWKDDSVTNLNYRIRDNPGWVLANARDINDAGHIVGGAYNPDGEQHAFLLTPVNSTDLDGDGDTDIDDYRIFQLGFTGPK